ncbi:uncharacterized protein LOC121302437 [Polyodon spathula]|uniref:uncharacterized protein LOC121302437 n=1 Tax=Polyodon spathula TaxID=7913 RepID=UPI001B7F04D6|nr:uncharacterized protein LOC121302437 [Polyodon spathula]
MTWIITWHQTQPILRTRCLAERTRTRQRHLYFEKGVEGEVVGYDEIKMQWEGGAVVILLRHSTHDQIRITKLSDTKARPWVTLFPMRRLLLLLVAVQAVLCYNGSLRTRGKQIKYKWITSRSQANFFKAQLTATTPALTGKRRPTSSLHTAGPPCSQHRATASEDNAALGSLQASSQAPGKITGVAGAQMSRGYPGPTQALTIPT